MIVPIRCFSCGKVLAQDYEEYVKRTSEKKETPEKVLDELGIKRYCCRRTIFSHVDLIDEIMKYNV
ncbi:MAG: DNA-directed RNA polymerase subunit N [Candidatus Diapherotrites archaeon]